MNVKENNFTFLDFTLSTYLIPFSWIVPPDWISLLSYPQWGQEKAMTIISLKKGTRVRSNLVVPCSWQFIHKLSISENTLSGEMSSKRSLGWPSEPGVCCGWVSASEDIYKLILMPRQGERTQGSVGSCEITRNNLQNFYVQNTLALVTCTKKFIV